MEPLIKFTDLQIEPNCVYYLDTNIVVSAVLDNGNASSVYKQEVLNLLDRILLSDGFVVTGTITFTEIYTVLRTTELEKRKNKTQMQKSFFAKNPNVLTSIAEDSDRARESFLANIGHVVSINETSELLNLENLLVAKANIENRDARHIITAVSCGADVFLTADKDYAKFTTNDIKIAFPQSLILPNYSSGPTISIPLYNHIDIEDK